MSQYNTPYSYQANNMFNMFDPEKWKKNKLMETPITAAEAKAGVGPLYQINETDLSKKGMMPVVDASGNVTGSGMHPGMESGYQPNYGVQNPIPSAITVPSQSGAPSDPDQTIYRTPQGTPAVASGPKLTPEARQTYTGYSKSMDKTFMMAALQSAIPKNDQTPARQAPSGGGRGGGNRMDQLTPYASAIKLDDENYPSLWRYS